MILGSYRNGDANDPDIYVRAVAAVLGCYVLEVMKAVADPRYGIASKSKWLPTVAEIKEACEEEMEPVYRRRRQDTLDRERAAALSAPPITRMTREEIVAKYGEGYGLTADVSMNDLADKRTAQVTRANDVLLRGEYESSHVEVLEAAPGIPVSIYLARKLGGLK